MGTLREPECAAPGPVATPLGRGVDTGIGSLPHLDAATAAGFVLERMSIPAMPTLPRRSPAEGMIAQALVGIEGVDVVQYGSIAVDVARIDPERPVATRLDHDAFGGFRAFLDVARGRVHAGGTVKWQFTGPITLGVALMRAGAPAGLAFDVAGRSVRAHLGAILDAVDDTLPGVRQLVFVDEPLMSEIFDSSFPVAPDAAIDLVSGALASIETRGVAGVHCCGDLDWGSIVAAGPQVLSIPANEAALRGAGQLQDFLGRGGLVAWGVIPTGGPIGTSSERSWRMLVELWNHLGDHGCDPDVLREQSLITPECGLGMHTTAVAERVHRLTREVARRVQEQCHGTGFAADG